MIPRLARADDAPFISRLVIAAWRETYASFLPPTLLAGLEDNPWHDEACWRARIAEPASRVWVLPDAAGQDAGVLRLTRDESAVPGTRAEMTTLYLAPQARGRGAGAAALAFLREAAAGLGPVGICVLAGNDRGEAFYRRQGALFVAEAVAFEWEGAAIMERQYRLP